MTTQKGMVFFTSGSLLRTAGRRTVEGFWDTVGGVSGPHLCHRMPDLFPTLRMAGHYTIMKTAPRG
jgi:hypothetical protein